MGPHDCAVREATGVGSIMWGSDYPHSEGTHPYTKEALRYTFAGVDVDEVRLMLGTNAARAYGFDLDALSPLSDQIGPLVAEVAEPLGADEFPADAALACARSDEEAGRQHLLIRVDRPRSTPSGPSGGGDTTGWSPRRDR